MASSSKKRTLDSFFVPASKKRSPSQPTQDGKDAVPSPQEEAPSFSTHFTYPFPIQDLPPSLHDTITWLPNRSALPIPKYISNQPDLDLLYYDPYIPRPLSQDLFRFLRSSLPFYRVQYTINRGPVATNITTPRFTTVFGLDATSRFDEAGQPVDAATRTQTRREPEYTTIPPRPLPQSLETLRKITEKACHGAKFNFCLVNYYASGADSVAYHSDDERFLGPNPAIASLSLGAKRDFLLKHKPINGAQPPGTEVLKIPLESGDLVLMRGKTQANWLHSIPKRAGAAKDDGGRINITFRRALVKGGTANYMQYNVGTGSVYRWDEDRREMKVWEQKEEVKIHRGPVVKIEEGLRAAGSGQQVKDELKAKADLNIVGGVLLAKEEEDATQRKAEVKMRGWPKKAIKAEESTSADVVETEHHTTASSNVMEFALDDDEEWEEKIRREIEGELD